MVPAFAGLVGSTGLVFFLHTAYLLPLTVLTLLVAIGALGFRAGRRRGYGPLAVSLVAAALVVVGKIAVDWTLLTYGGVALLVAASVWNSWPAKAAGADLVQLGVQRGDSRGQSGTVDYTTEG